MPLIDVIKLGCSDGLDAKMQALVHISRTVRRDARDADGGRRRGGPRGRRPDADVQLAVLIASAFSMYNRMVEGFRARTPPTAEAYRARAGEIAENGYSARRSRRLRSTSRTDLTPGNRTTGAVAPVGGG